MDWRENIKLTTIYQWAAYAGTPKSALKRPPATLYVLENTTSEMHTWGDALSWLHYSGINLDDGFSGDQPTTADDGGMVVSGSHLSRHNASGGDVTVTRSMSVSGHIAVDVGQGQRGAAIIGCVYGIAEDTRSAMITCQDIETPANWHISGEASGGPSAADTRNLNVRDDDGVMSVDTVAAPGADIHSWTFNAHLIAETTGFDMTENFWNGYPANTSVLWTPSVYSSDRAMSEIDILTGGKNSDLSKKAYVTKVHIKLEDLRPNMEATAENDYTIRVHAPMENQFEIKSKQHFDHDEVFKWSDSVDAGIRNATVAVEKDPVNCIWRDNIITQHSEIIGATLSGVAGSGSAGLIFVNAPAPWMIIADMAFNILGYTLTTYGAPPTAQTQSEPADYKAFLQAVNEQYDIMINHVTSDNMVCLNENRIIAPDRIEVIHANPMKYWLASRHPTARCHAGTRMNCCTVGGDQYNVNGYVGYHEGEYVVPGPDFLVWQFTLTGTAVPNPN